MNLFRLPLFFGFNTSPGKMVGLRFKMKNIRIFWFRRDLRLHDNAGLYRALKSGKSVLPLFIFDKNILDELPRDDARVSFIHETIFDLKKELENLGSSLIVRYGKPQEIWKNLIEEYDIEAVFTNHDFEPYANQRDRETEQLLSTKNITFHTFKDHVIFEKNEVVKDDGKPYTVFTPYSRKWKAKLTTRPDSFFNRKNEKEAVSFFFKPYPNEKYFSNFLKINPLENTNLNELGFIKSGLEIPGATVTRKTIREYAQNRDFPAVNGTSKLGIHFRFGTISIREKARRAQPISETYLNELIWRDFYAQILWHFPHVVTDPFRKKYNAVPWRNHQSDFEKWCDGKTGYPMVDAGMRELNATGYMHNRVRMITASFLTKHLLTDWRRGEAYFAEKLLDFDLASNNGGWQWAAGCGTDAAPYFRIFNPESQQKKFDKNFEYIKKWIPEFGTPDYPEPMVDHKFARERCLATYKAALG